MITKLGMVSFIIIQFIYVIYQQIAITVQYKINLNSMFKEILYPTFFVHCILFKIKLLTGVLCTSPVLLLQLPLDDACQ